MQWFLINLMKVKKFEMKVKSQEILKEMKSGEKSEKKD